MQPRSITDSGGSHPQQKTYYIPPPPPPTKFPLKRSPVPIYSHSNNSYHPDAHSRKYSTSSDSYRSRSSSLGSTPKPQLPQYEPTPTSRYIHMLLSIDSIPKIYNLLAAFSTWILLAGYVLLPGTFTSLQNMPTPTESDPDYDPNDPPNKIEIWILERVRNTPLLYIATACSIVGVVGMCGLWFRWRKNYVWILNRIFLPGMLNSLAGIISTIVNVHTAQEGKYSLTAIITVVITASSTVINGALWLVYNNWALRRVQELHRQEYFEKGRGNVELGENGELVEVHSHRTSV